MRYFKWYRKLKGGIWFKIWYNFRFQGGHEIWTRFPDVTHPYDRMLEVEVY